MASPALEEYQIGWICALPIEAAAAQEMLDESFGTLEEQDTADTNIYTLGRMGKHYIVIACLGGHYGTTSATIVVNNMMRTFSKSLQIGLMVGIGGGMPSVANDIRLGDVVVSYPTGTCGGVLQHDMGKISQDGKLARTGSMNSPPRLLLAAVNKMRAAELTSDPCYISYIDKVVQKNRRTQRNFGRPDPRYDRLFQIQYDHPSDAATCDGCSAEWEVKRDEREDHQPQPHYGIIASGNAVIKHGGFRERLWKETGALCFEMEAAGLMVDFPCIVVRGICDYSDSHKNKQWQGYAALVAASYTKELLGYMPRGQVSQEKLVTEISTISVWLQSLSRNADNITQKIDLSQLQIAKGAAFNSYENKHADCLPGTRSDVLCQIKEWAESPHGKCIFWLNSMAGTGKSTISRTISRHFKEQGTLGASFFFKRGEEDRGNARRLFPTLVKQLVTSIPQLIPSIQEAIADDVNISERALREQFERLLLQPLLEMKESVNTAMVIVIDALDECDQEDDVGFILRLLPRVQRSNSVKLRFLLTSRPDLPIRFGFKGIADDHQDLILHQIPRLVIEHDISLYFQAKLAQLRERRPLSPGWPGSERINALTEGAVPLFISAATMYRFISDEKWNPEKRLEAILANNTSYVSKMDNTYMTVLSQLLTGQDEWESQQLIEEFKEIVGIIILLATPLSVIAISQIANIDLGDINNRLDLLHSVLEVPQDQFTPVRLLHLSFRDFLLDTKTKERKESEKFWIDEKAGHGYLTRQCLELMRCRLKKNICNLPSGDIHSSEIDKNCVDYYLPPELQYACRYWTEHLVQSQDPISALVKAFSVLRVHLLHWLEAMSILGLISEAVGRITTLQPIIQSCEDSQISKFYYDATRFILKNRHMADIAPLQLYSSGLIFCPRNSVTRGLFKNELSNWYQLPRVEEKWNAELQTLEGHSDLVRSVTFSPDGQLLASSSDDKTVNLWDPSTGELRQTLKGHSDRVESVTFSPDGRLLASGSDDTTIKLWDPSTGELRQTLKGHSDWALSVTFSPDGRLLVSGSADKTIGLWDPSTGELRQTLKGHSSLVLSVTFSPDGRLLASGSDDTTIKLWDPSTGELRQTLRGHSRLVRSVTFSPDGRLLASSSDDTTIKLWDPSTGELRQTLRGHSRLVQSVTFSPDGWLLASGSDDTTIKLWDSSTGELRQTLEGYSGSVLSVTFSPDGRLLASDSNEKTIKLWDPRTGELRQTLKRHSYWFWSVTFSPDGQAEKNVNISIQDDQWIYLQGKRRLWLPSEYRATCLALKGSRFALGHASGRISFFSVEL